MASLVGLRSSLDDVSPHHPFLGKPYYKDTRLEFHCFTKGKSKLHPLEDVRARIRPARRELRDAKGDEKILMAASKMMMRKNQKWLSLEDLPTQALGESSPSDLVKYDDPSIQGVDRRSRTQLATIPDEAPVTMTRAISLNILNDPSDFEPISPSPVSPLPITDTFAFSNSSIQDLVDNDTNSSYVPKASTTPASSGTLTPSSDTTLSPDVSEEDLCSSSALTSITSSPSFALHRGDSVNGLFMTSKSSSQEDLERSYSAYHPEQSPFRRQLFTSLMTGRSALVSRVNQQTCSSTVKTAAPMAETTLSYVKDQTAQKLVMASPRRRTQSSPAEFFDFLQENNITQLAEKEGKSLSLQPTGKEDSSLKPIADVSSLLIDEVAVSGSQLAEDSSLQQSEDSSLQPANVQDCSHLPEEVQGATEKAANSRLQLIIGRDTVSSQPANDSSSQPAEDSSSQQAEETENSNLKQAEETVSSNSQLVDNFRSQLREYLNSHPAKETSDVSSLVVEYSGSHLGEYLNSHPAKEASDVSSLVVEYSGSHLGEELPDINPVLRAPFQMPDMMRAADRLVSFCDSGLGWDTDHSLSNVDTDEDLRSPSTGSFSTLSEDSGGVQEEDLVLCGSRVSQMTKTYNDIDAVTRLLQEKEKDLELAAKIGQQLLNRNKALEERNALLDAEVATATEKITQLKHDLQMKTELLQIYTNDVDDTSSCETTPTSMRLINVDILEHRVKNLEDENRSLRQEASKLASDTMECEDREKELVTDVIKQLTDANLQVRQLSEELAKKAEDSLRQQEEITQLLAQVVDLQARVKRLTGENDELAAMVGVARECQQELTVELAELKERYAEVLDLLHDTQDQLRRAQKKHLPGSRGHHLGSHGLFSSPFNPSNDSIASELHSLSSGGEEGGRGGSNNMRRTFDTVRLTGKHSGLGSSQGSLNSLGYGGSLHSTPTHLAGGTGPGAGYLGSRGSSVYSGGSGHPSLDSGADSDASMHTDSEDNYPGSQLGVPGWPGTPDLDSCLRRLGPTHDHRTPSHFLPYGCRTPDSIMSTGSGKSGLSAYGGVGGTDWKLPQKLQIVKPIEGSLTLHQWSRLATPHLGGLLEEREGVAIKGGTGTELNLDVYSMSDFEEDEMEEENPGKQFMSTSGVFTYTNSTILHPDDQVSATPSIRQAQVSVLPTSSSSAAPSGAAPTPSTPIRNPSVPPSRRGSTATFSVNTGLAKMLNERGTTKSDTNSFAPTATPANSPTATRPGSPEPERYKLPGLEELTKTFYYGASLLRRTFYKSDPSAPQSPTGPQVNLVEQVQAIGVDRFVGLHGSALSVGGVVTSRPATSPLLHLSNLIMSSAKNSSATSGVNGSTTSSPTTTSSAVTTVTSSGQAASGIIMAAPKIPSPGERRPTLPSGAPMGIPGHPGSGHLDNRLSQLKPGQRADLGTVGGRPRPTSLGTVPTRGSQAEANVGTVGWTSFGRKGGLL